MSIKDHPIIFVCGLVIAAFVSGWAAYENVQTIADSNIVELKKEIKTLKQENIELAESISKLDTTTRNYDCRMIRVEGGKDNKSCPTGTVMMGLTQAYDGGRGALRTWIDGINCCKIH